MSDTRTRIFMFLVLFWIGLVIFSSQFNVDVLVGTNEYKTVSGISMLFKIMTFQHVNTFPILLSGFLDFIVILSIYIGYTLISPLD